MERILKGLQIIAKYEPKADFAAEHDIIYCGDEGNYSAEDKQALDELGWFVSEDSWAFFV